MLAANHPTTEKTLSDISVPNCPACGAKPIKKGCRVTQHRGKVRKFYCKTCKKTFTPDDGFFRMRHAPKAITKAIDLYFSNLSSRKVRSQYRRHEDAHMSHVTVLDWCRRYTMRVQRWIARQEPRIGGQCYADETEIPCGGERHRFWACIDWKTRYISATHYSTIGNVEEAAVFLSRMKPYHPRYIQTDAAQFYPAAMRKIFFSLRAKGLGVEHRVNNTHKTKKHNVRIEALFMKIKDRVIDMRGFKAIWSAPILLTGIVIQHNWVEEHTTTRELPAKLARLVSYEGNRWLCLIHIASS